ncbi:SAE2-domain-containing protein [Stipitochalara longipes BDJ]|nr:SAE2-domain-containing protein [Stipitochalara longipes BDJ]
MESWKNGRRDLFDQLTKVCDRIGQDLAAELDDKNVVRISQEELRLLRETSGRIEKLVERNAYLSDELDKWKEASARVNGLETENKRLAGELAQSLKQQHQVSGTPKPRFQAGASSKSTTPTPSDPKSSATGMEADLSKSMVTKEKYQSLVIKYNKLCDKYKVVDEVRQTVDDALRVEREGMRRWMAWEKIQNEAMGKKNDKIQRLEEEIQRLRAQSNGERGLSMAPLARPDGENADEFEREGTRLLQVPMSSPCKGRKVAAATVEHEGAEQAPGVVEPVDRRNPEELNLPAHRIVADMQVEDTDFEQIEAQHTSSTEGSDPLSPSKAAGRGQFSIEKPTAQRSSSPAIIEVRCVKKRKTPHESQKIKTEVKVETISSSPIGLARLQYLDPYESLDLDDIGEKVDTPRKQRRVIELTRHNSKSVSLSPLTAKLRGQRQSQGHSNTTEEEGVGNASQETPVRHRDSILQPRSINRQILPRTSEDRASKKRRIASDEAVGELLEDGEIEAAATKSRRQTANSNDRLSGLLAKPSPPKQILSPRLALASDQQQRLARTPLTSGLAREPQCPPQDVYGRIMDSTLARLKEYFPSSSRRRGQESEESSRPSSKGSSHGNSAEPMLPSSRTSLRESAGPSRPTSKGTSRGSEEPLRPTSKGTSRGSVQTPLVQNTYLPPKRLLPADLAKASPRTPAVNSRPLAQQTAGSSKIVRSNPRRSRNDDVPDREIDPEQEPLRARPVSGLKLGDFKVNPNYNQGYNYAFSEVVRGQTARQQCLQGCTKPECCGGKFRTLVEMDHEGRGTPTLSQEEADEMLLDEYLGDNAYKKRNMSKEQKEELIIQAKTRDMANKYGRHRHAYERRTSPPGFWRADFPTTQEDREDREKAKELERSAVEERYKEAMRPNGRFIFRDE